VLVSDTDANRVRRVDPKTGAATTLMKTGEPRGIDVAADGSLYVVDAAAHRVAHFMSNGRRLGWVGGRFGDPYAVVAAPAAVYVVDTSAAGTVVRVARDGSASTIAA
jgi:glucose/arabinose dehydrogenase